MNARWHWLSCMANSPISIGNEADSYVWGGSTYHAEYIPLGSVWYSLASFPLGSNPMTRVLIPNGLTPPDCVYRCWTPAMYFVMYSIDTGSSTVNRWDCASRRALSTRIRASALRPAKARHTWLSTREILEGVILVSCSFIALLFSHPRTTMPSPLTPTAHVPGQILALVPNCRYRWRLVSAM